jgi:hypothetical protein
LVEGVVGFAVSSFDFGQRLGGLIGAALEEAVGEGSADALVKEHKEQSDTGALVGEAISIASAITLE